MKRFFLYFKTGYGTRQKPKKQGASIRIMKVTQLEDEPFLPISWRIKKIIELEKDAPTVRTSRC